MSFFYKLFATSGLSVESVIVMVGIVRLISLDFEVIAYEDSGSISLSFIFLSLFLRK